MLEYPGLCKSGIAIVKDIPFCICKELTLIYVIENDLNFRTVSGVHTLHTGETEIINVKEPIELKPVDNYSKILFFSFDKFYLGTFDYNFENVTYNCNVTNFYGVNANKEDIKQLTKRMFDIIVSMHSGMQYNIIRKDVAVLLEFIRNNFDDVAHAFADDSRKDISRERFQRISQYMIAHVSEKISLKNLTKYEYVSTQYLSKEFTNNLGRNYHDVINYYRIINAVIQLLDTDDGLTNIAENSGFSSVRYYNKTFTEYMGCLPSKFRSIYKNSKINVITENISKEYIDRIIRDLSGDIKVREYVFTSLEHGDIVTLSTEKQGCIAQISLNEGEYAEITVTIRKKVTDQ